MGRWRSGLVLFVCGALLVALGPSEVVVPAASAKSARGPFVQIKVLSNRADLVSGGDALVAIRVPSSLPQTVKVTSSGKDVTKKFRRRSNGEFRGLVTGLKLGRNVLQARLPDGRGARLTITNHPNGGPIFSGPHRQPWTCQEGAVDKFCNQPAQYQYLYQAMGRKDLQPYDPANPPGDVAMTTTDQGDTVPFIVRQEIGYQDRSQYTTLVLLDPSKKMIEQFDPTHPSIEYGSWNHKIYIPHGGGCGGTYGVDTAPLTASFGDQGNQVRSYSYVTALSRGFAVLSTALENAGANCDIALQAESLVMAKERIAEVYGPIRYTIGEGCSGGSLVPQQVANAYPGIYQGVVVTCSFPDFWSSLAWFTDLHLMALYFAGFDCDPAPAGFGGAEQRSKCDQSNAGTANTATTLWTPPAIEAVLGRPIKDHVGDTILLSWLQGGGVNPYMSACAGIEADQIYHPESNPGGIRCSTADWGVNLLGRRQRAVWSAPEREIGRGFGGRPYGNVGIMYGLEALESGAITPDQFVNLNSKIGSVDIDLNVSPKRVQADQPALLNAYKSGSINDASHMDQVAILNGTGPNDGIYAHPPSGAMEIRARLDRQFGHHKNQVLWEGPTTIISDAEFYNNGLIAMDQWLAAVEADKSNRSLSQKIGDHRPDDACFDGAGHQTGVYGDPGCPFVPIHRQPRQVAGAPATNDVNACQLKPLRRTDYDGEFTDAQWAELKKTFPQGVCDYSKPGISQRQRTIAWQTYQDSKGRAIVGGKPMPSRPVSTPFG